MQNLYFTELYTSTENYQCVSVYLMRQHPVQLLFRDSKPFSVCTVHYQDDEL